MILYTGVDFFDSFDDVHSAAITPIMRNRATTPLSKAVGRPG